MTTKKLKDLIKNMSHSTSFGDLNIQTSSITDDSRKVQAGSLFVAISGINSDGHDFVKQAIEKGAIAVVGEKGLKELKVPYIKVKNSKKALSHLASAWYDNPSNKLKMIGVTGTDGKTTTATLIYEILRNAGKKVSLISTVSAKIGSEEFDTGFHVTNPEALELQKFLNLMVEKACEYCVLEVTSHGIDQERVAGIKFDISVLTNITHEHLDYHKTYENYLKTKARLFLKSKISVLNKDDSSFEKVKQIIKKETQVVEYSIKDLDGEVKDIIFQRFPEIYNRSNASAAITVAKKLGINNGDIVQSIKSFKGIEGRMQEIENDKGIKIIVDFAHTPNALERVLSSLLQKNGKLIVVFGCASERDNAKRPMMAKIATSLADISVFTAEDPRKEDINKILNEMAEGAEKAIEINRDADTKILDSEKYFVKIPERGEAISFAINKLAKNGDTVVVTGKGHEKSMSYNGIEYPWSDQEAVQMALDDKVKEIKR